MKIHKQLYILGVILSVLSFISANQISGSDMHVWYGGFSLISGILATYAFVGGTIMLVDDNK